MTSGAFLEAYRDEDSPCLQTVPWVSGFIAKGARKFSFQSLGTLVGEGGMMANDSALAEFKQGINLLRDGHSAEAVEYLRRAAELKQKEPYYLSFLGVSVARSQRKWASAASLCETALRLRRTEAQLYLNLAEVYVLAGRRDDAVETLDAALRYCGARDGITQMRGRLGRRSSPVLAFLARDHFLNQSLGKLRHRLLGRLRN
jgi:tetratricopeptide (TPR) repeat protein